MLNYWARLILLPSSRLVSHCYWSLFENPQTSDPWLNSIKDIIYSTGQYHIWEDQKNLSTSEPKYLEKQLYYLKENLKDQYIQKSSVNLCAESKLVFLNMLKRP